MQAFAKTLSAATILSAVLLSAGAAKADLLLTNADATAYAGATSITEGAFTITFNAITSASAASADWFTGADPTASISITATDGGLFTLSGFDGIGLFVYADGYIAQSVLDGYDATASYLASAGGAVAVGTVTNFGAGGLDGIQVAQLTIGNSSLYGSDGPLYTQAGVANINVTEAPEPASMALLGTGLAVLGLGRRRRRG